MNSYVRSSSCTHAFLFLRPNSSMPSARVQPRPRDAAPATAPTDISAAHVLLIERHFSQTVNEVAVQRPANPIKFIGQALLRQAVAIEPARDAL